MCGIGAIVSSTPLAAHVIRDMMDVVRHRGPDDEGYLIASDAAGAVELFGGPSTPVDAFASGLAFSPTGRIESAANAPAAVSLGFRRLAILDLSVRGHQPMSTPDRRYWIVFNGEIYNYRELGEELARLGHRFVSHSDTEVFVAAYAEWGSECLHRLNGMWACVIYDAERAQIIASRDRFGVKPLYYWIAPSGAACFASEIKQFTAIPGWRAVVNIPRASTFLDTGLTDHDDETMFAGVFALGPGALVRLPVTAPQARPDGRLDVESWYGLRPASFSGSFEEAAAECERLLTDSVRLMLRSDVAIGSCLSGGIDSSSIVGLSHRLLAAQGVTGRHRTFSALAPATPLDEREWIQMVVEDTGVDASFTVPSAAHLASVATRLAWHQDEPYTSTSVFAQWCVFELAAANGVTVMLDGQGADEAFAGYHSFFAPYLTGLMSHGRVREAWHEFRRLHARHGLSARRALRAVTASLGGDRSSIATWSYAQLTSTNLQMLLRFEDRNSMAHSIEARVPFLDHRLVEFALGLPDSFKIHDGVTKRVLRAAMNGVLPDPIRDRVAKIGFETPESAWMTAGDERPWFRAELAQAMEVSDRLIPASALVRFDAMVQGRAAEHRRAWRAISFGQWMRAFGVAAPTPARSLPA